jgi:3-hydroxyacyl-CoA dehydrogenase
LALQEGIGTVADFDKGIKLGLNHPMGPFELSDLIGLDTSLPIAEVRTASWARTSPGPRRNGRARNLRITTA